jgi:signal transduction histidine kinase
MGHSPNGSVPTTSNLHLLLGYVADLELEVDRLRKQGQFVQHEARGTLKRIRLLCADAAGAGEVRPRLGEIDQAAQQLAAGLRDLQEGPGYHPAHDQVVAIAVRPLAEQVFRFQQRLVGAAAVSLRLELESEHVEWFPARLRHILDNLLSNSLKYRDPAKAESWVRLGVRASTEGYELRVSDNGVGPAAGRARPGVRAVLPGGPGAGGRPGGRPGRRQAARGTVRGDADRGLWRGAGDHLRGAAAALRRR